MSTITTSGSGFWYGDDCSLSRKYVCKREAGVPCTTVPPPVTVRPSSTNPSNCNAGLLMSPGVFTSPNYPQNYFNNENCTYQLSTLGSYRITLKFSNFRTESNYDFVSVYDGPTTSSPSLGRYSGNIGSFYVSSSENNMLVTFTSDAGVVFQGFTARFYSVVHRSWRCFFFKVWAFFVNLWKKQKRIFLNFNWSIKMFFIFSQFLFWNIIILEYLCLEYKRDENQ